MKWQLILAGALAALFGTLFIASMASADVRIIGDPGGEVSSYRQTFYEMRSSGERIVIDGPCLSACTLLTAIVPRHHVCVTKRAVLGFHAASYYNDVSRSLTPTRAGTRFLMRLYPPEIRAWINRRGGLSPQLIRMRGPDLAALYSPCRHVLKRWRNGKFSQFARAVSFGTSTLRSTSARSVGSAST